MNKDIFIPVGGFTKDTITSGNHLQLNHLMTEQKCVIHGKPYYVMPCTFFLDLKHREDGENSPKPTVCHCCLWWITLLKYYAIMQTHIVTQFWVIVLGTFLMFKFKLIFTNCFSSIIWSNLGIITSGYVRKYFILCNFIVKLCMQILFGNQMMWSQVLLKPSLVLRPYYYLFDQMIPVLHCIPITRATAWNYTQWSIMWKYS